MKHWYIELHNGYSTIRKSPDDMNELVAKQRAYLSEGTHNVRVVREAERDEIDWHLAMGGYIYDI